MPAASLFAIALVSAKFKIINGTRPRGRAEKNRMDGPTKPGRRKNYDRFVHHHERTD
jgi:hypothetical protein